MDDVLHTLLNREEVFIPLLIAVSILTGILISAFTKLVRHGASERTKREIAAYIAEGSMTPEQGERILKAGGNRNRHT